MATGVSRLLGFIRDILLARLFGTTAQAQAFVVAFRLPNLMRDLVAEGAVTSAFVPVLSWYRAKR
ncbi:MAG: murein biosynthesis integral membrane protein MurJ, partial [Candidatus Omnitrophica bacterium]|nr:murein biosynthesis integral membrane protein MurJ [Candidatus Omnitrophota bacterium]